VLAISFVGLQVRKAREGLSLSPSMTSAEFLETGSGRELDLRRDELGVSYEDLRQVGHL